MIALLISLALSLVSPAAAGVPAWANVSTSTGTGTTYLAGDMKVYSSTRAASVSPVMQLDGPGKLFRFYGSSISFSGGSIENVNYVQLNTNWDDGHSIGRFQWDGHHGLPTIGLAADVNGTVFDEMLEYGYNDTGAAIPDGTPVYQCGIHAHRAKICLASALSSQTADIIGITTQQIEDKGSGYIAYVGDVHNLNLSQFSLGQKIYLSTESGKITGSIPANAARVVVIGEIRDNSHALGVLRVYKNYVPHQIRIDSMTATTVCIGADCRTAWPVGGDNLGNHIATMSINMGKFSVVRSSAVEADVFQTSGTVVMSMRCGNEDNCVSIGKGAGLGIGGASQKNVYVGAYSGYGNSGYRNVCVGNSACQQGSASSYNTAIGDYSLFYGGGAQNTCIGSNSCFGVNTGRYNTYIGNNTGATEWSTGDRNVALGYYAGKSAVSGARNVFIGQESGYSNTSGSDNTFLGSQAGYSVTSGTGNIIIGSGSGAPSATTSNYLNIGNIYKADMSVSSASIAGTLNMAYAVNTSSHISAAAYQINGSTIAHNKGLSNTFLGELSGATFSTGRDLVCVGNSACNYSAPGSYNTFIGNESGKGGSNGDENVGVGFRVNASGAWGRDNAVLGSQAAYNSTIMNRSTLLGMSAGNISSGASDLLCAGYASCYRMANSVKNTCLGGLSCFTDGIKNNIVAVGYKSGYALTTGHENTLLGYQAGQTITSGTNNIIIGANADAPSATTSNYLNIGGAIVGDMSASSVTAKGTFTITNQLLVAATAQAGYGVNIATPVYFSGAGKFWDDIRTPLLSAGGATIRPPALKRFRRNAAGTSEGLYLYAFGDENQAANEQELFLTVQMPHGWDGSPIEPHLHFSVVDSSTPGTDDTVVWGLEYSCAGIGDTFPVTATMKATSTVSAAYGSAYADFPMLQPPTGISAQCAFRVYRNSSAAQDNFQHDVFAIELDFHVRRNALGSREETGY